MSSPRHHPRRDSPLAAGARPSRCWRPGDGGCTVRRAMRIRDHLRRREAAPLPPVYVGSHDHKLLRIRPLRLDYDECLTREDKARERAYYEADRFRLTPGVARGSSRTTGTTKAWPGALRASRDVLFKVMPTRS